MSQQSNNNNKQYQNRRSFNHLNANESYAQWQVNLKTSSGKY